MENNIIICDASLEDVEQILNIEKTLEHKILSKSSLENSINSEMYRVFVAKNNNEVWGYLILALNIDHADLEAIVVKKEHRNKHVATSILNKTIEYCKYIGMNRIMLEVRESNNAAQALYKKHGFVDIWKRERYYTDNKEAALIYSLDFTK